MTVTRLSPLDATFLHIEDDVSHMHIGSVGIFEGPPPAHADLLAAIAGKLHLAPRYRQRVRFVPLQAGRPVWVDDPHFKLGYHVRRTALPTPGGDEQLRDLVGRVMSQQLDRTRPLWEMWVVEGLADGRWALISKLHHAMVDGVSGSNLVTAMMDPRRDAPVPEPDAVDAGTDAPGDRARRERAGRACALAAARGARRREVAARSRRRRRPRRAHGSRASPPTRASCGRPPPTALNGPIGPHRRWDWARARLADVKEIRAAFGGTVNDVVLAAITAGFRDLLLSRGEPTEPGRPHARAGVGARKRTSAGVHDNRVSAMFADLPVGDRRPGRAARTRSRRR